MFRFDNHTFDPDTGELDGPRESLRLQPKPARLLAMLLAAGGELVERDDIRAALWPDTTVDFDAGLNTCVRQIRTALTETGGAAEYVETLPKRGYRIVVPVAHDTAHLQPEAEAPTEELRLSSAAAIPYVLVFILLAAGTGFLLWNELIAARPSEQEVGGSASSAPARLAVLPFVDPDSDDPGTLNRELGEAFVAALVAAAPDEVVVVGPSTTAQHLGPDVTLAAIAGAVNADFVLHGGHRAGTGVFFVEVVLPDGEHLFARRFEQVNGTPAEIAADVVPEMTASILAARRR